MRRFTNYFTKQASQAPTKLSAKGKLIGGTLLMSTIASGFYLKNQQTMLMTQFNDSQGVITEGQADQGEELTYL